MGESAACLVHSFCQPSPTSGEEKKNHLHRALTTSVSFGRFMSESLDWVKWSAFTQNRYMEEVEKYSKPGSVAEKKAYFEAHFKRRRAAALLEQQNAASNATVTDSFPADAENMVKEAPAAPNLNLVQRDIVHKSMKEEDVQIGCTIIPASQNVTSAEVMVKDTKPGGVVISTEPQALVESQVGKTNHLKNDDKSKLEDEAREKDDSLKRNSVLPSEASSMFLINDSAPKCPRSPLVKLILPVQLKNSEKTPNSSDNVKDSGNKRRSYTTSLQVPINLASCLGETQKATTPVQPKITSNGVHRGPAKRFKNSARSQTKTMEAAEGIFKKHLAATTQQDNRIEPILGNSLSRNRTLDGKTQFPPMKCSKSSTAFGSKARTPTVACPFTFKSEERAAKRKEKLEQKLKSNDTEEKQRPLVQLQVKTRNSIKQQVHQSSIRTEATKDPEIPSTNNLTKKSVSSVRPRNPKAEERTYLKLVSGNSGSGRDHLWRRKVMGESNEVTKMVGLKNKHCVVGVKRNMNENASPNIQL